MGIRKFFIVFSTIWTLITCIALSILAYSVGNQFRTRNWTPTTGTVLYSQVKVSHGSKSTTYGIDIQYRYQAAGQSFTSDRVRFLQGSSSDSSAYNFVQRHPAESSITVYYNPSNPSEAALVRNLEGFDYFLILFMTPFTMVMIGTWFAIARTFRKKSGFAGLRIEDNSSQTRVRPSLLSAFYAFAFGCGLTAFVSMFVIAFTAGGFHPKIETVQFAYPIVLAVGLISGLVMTYLILSGYRDTILDDNSKSLTLPGRTTIHYADITEIRIAANYQQSASTNNQQYPTYEVWVDYSLASKTQSKKLAHWLGNLEAAQRFALWLSTRTDTPLKATGECALPSQPLPAN